MADQQQSKVKGVADIVFLMDATGSMATCIDQLKENLKTFIDALVTPAGNDVSPVKDWRAKVVGYRDAEADGAEWFVDHPFVRDVGQLKGQFNDLEAKGGGDTPETLLDAIYKISSVGQTGKQETEDPAKWRYRSAAARVVVIFTDADYKPAMVIPEAKDGGLNDIVNAVTANRIILSIFAPEMECFHQLGAIDKAEYLPIPVEGVGPQAALVKFTSDTKNFTATLVQLAKSVSKSTETATL